MNKSKQEQEKRTMLRRIRHTSLSGNKMNHFTFYNSEQDAHIKKKWEVFFKLRRAGYDCWTEVIFNSGIRMDILAYKEGFWSNYEILSSETSKELAKKVKNYPDVEVISVDIDQDLEDLEMF